MLSNGVLIQGITREEFLEAINRVVGAIEAKYAKAEYTVKEVSVMTGYSAFRLRQLLVERSIPYRKAGRRIYIPHSSLSKLNTK